MSNVTELDELDVTFIALLISFISIEPEPSESNRLNASRSSSICSSESPPPFFFFPPAAPRRDWHNHTIRKMRAFRHGAANLRDKGKGCASLGSHSPFCKSDLILERSNPKIKQKTSLQLTGQNLIFLSVEAGASLF